MAAANHAVPIREEMESLNLFKMAGVFYNNTPATIDWCRRHGLLAAALLCEKCNLQCTEGTLSVAPEGRTWRCPSCRSRYVNSELELPTRSGRMCRLVMYRFPNNLYFRLMYKLFGKRYITNLHIRPRSFPFFSKNLSLSIPCVLKLDIQI